VSLPRTDDELALLHNPRCSKSRAAKALLEERGAHFVERRYLEQPLSRAELAELRTRLGRPVAEWTRRQEEAYRTAGLAADASEEALLETKQAVVVMRRMLDLIESEVAG